MAGDSVRLQIVKIGVDPPNGNPVTCAKNCAVILKID
jgi:hypothetical protein